MVVNQTKHPKIKIFSLKRIFKKIFTMINVNMLITIIEIKEFLPTTENFQ